MGIEQREFLHQFNGLLVERCARMSQACQGLTEHQRLEVHVANSDLEGGKDKKK